MKNLKFYLQKAQKEKFAIGQFNFSDYTQLKGIIEGANELKFPLILGTSQKESEYFGLEEAISLRDTLRRKLKLPIFLNFDHGKDVDYLKKVIRLGYDMIHFDGSELPLEENIKISKDLIKFAKKYKVLFEGEIGKFDTKASKVYEEKFEIAPENLSKPQEALEYITKTKCDLLALSLGSFHGISSVAPAPHLRLDILETIKKSLSFNVFFVLHGGSGTPEDDIKKSIETGIVKININTELRKAFTESLRESLLSNPNEIVPYKILPPVKEAIREIVKNKILLFKSFKKS